MNNLTVQCLLNNDLNVIKDNIQVEFMEKGRDRGLKEIDIQALIVQYLKAKDILFHPSLSGLVIPKKFYGILRLLKKIGIMKGYPDLYIVKNNGSDKVFFLELKAIGGILSKEQKYIIKRMKDEGVAVSVSYGVYDAVYKIEKYLRGEPIIFIDKKEVSENE